MKKETILLITTDFPPQRGGIAKWAYEEFKILKKKYNVIVIDKIKNKCRKNVICFKNQKHLKKIVKNFISERKHLRIIFFHWEPAKSLFPMLVFNHIPYTIVIHGWEFLRPRSLLTQFKKSLLLNFAERIWVTSPFMLNKVKKYLIQNTHIIKKKIPIDNRYKKMKNVKKTGIYKNKKIIISVGRLVERKGFQTVIDAVEKLIKKERNILYLIIGDGPQKNELHKIIKKKKMHNNVLILDSVSDKKLVELYNISDLFVLVPKEIKKYGDIEGFGIVYHEAHNCGLPVIGSNTGGVAYALSLIDNSYIVEPENVPALTKLIGKILLKK